MVGARSVPGLTCCPVRLLDFSLPIFSDVQGPEKLCRCYGGQSTRAAEIAIGRVVKFCDATSSMLTGCNMDWMM